MVLSLKWFLTDLKLKGKRLWVWPLALGPLFSYGSHLRTPQDFRGLTNIPTSSNTTLHLDGVVGLSLVDPSYERGSLQWGNRVCFYPQGHLVPNDPKVLDFATRPVWGHYISRTEPLGPVAIDNVMDQIASLKGLRQQYMEAFLNHYFGHQQASQTGVSVWALVAGSTFIGAPIFEALPHWGLVPLSLSLTFFGLGEYHRGTWKKKEKFFKKVFQDINVIQESLPLAKVARSFYIPLPRPDGHHMLRDALWSTAQIYNEMDFDFGLCPPVRDVAWSLEKITPMLGVPH